MTLCCHQPHTVALSFLPYEAGEQKLCVSGVFILSILDIEIAVFCLFSKKKNIVSFESG